MTKEMAWLLTGTVSPGVAFWTKKETPPKRGQFQVLGIFGTALGGGWGRERAVLLALCLDYPSAFRRTVMAITFFAISHVCDGRHSQRAAASLAFVSARGEVPWLLNSSCYAWDSCF